MFIRRIHHLLLWIFVTICSLHAHGNYSVLHYRIDKDLRLEAHFDSTSDGPQIQFLLFHKGLETPIVLEPKDPPFDFGRPRIDSQNRKYTLPLPDNQGSLSLPEWAAVDFNDSGTWRTNLQQEGMLIIGDHNSTGNFLQIFPLRANLENNSNKQIAYRIQEVRRLENYPHREYSLALVDSSRLSFVPESNLLMSIRDTNSQGGKWDLGTMVATQDGKMQLQSEKWIQLSSTAGPSKFVFAPSSESTSALNILAGDSEDNLKTWGRPVFFGKNVKSWQTDWPGVTNRRWHFSGSDAFRSHWEKVLGPIEWDNFTASLLRRIDRAEFNKSNRWEKPEVYFKALAAEKTDMQINADMQAIEQLVKTSDIETELKKMQLNSMGGYKVHPLRPHSSNKHLQTKAFVLAVLVSGPNDLSTKWMNWLVVLDQNNVLLERRPLRTDTLPLLGRAKPRSCIRAHRLE